MADISKVKLPNGDVYDIYDKLRYNKTVSRGEQLVVNGSGMMGDNTNFLKWDFDGSRSNSSPGSFTRTSTSYANINTADYFPVDANLKYRFDFDLVSKNNAGTMYAYLDFFNVDKINITAGDHMYYAGTTTTLTQDLKAGDTVVRLEDASNYRTYGTGSHQRALTFWDYKNSFGYLYPPETYSRNHIWSAWTDDNSIDKTNNTITLATPYTGVTRPAGTYVSQGGSGSTYKYSGIVGSKVPTEWTHYTGYFDGVDYSGKNKYDYFPPGTAYCKVGFLWDYNSADDQFWVTNVSVKEVPAEANTASVAEVMGNSTFHMRAERNNEINFGMPLGGNSNYVYFGYRESEERAIPTRFVFGGASGSADLLARNVYLGSSTSNYVSATQYTGNAASASALMKAGNKTSETIDDFHPTTIQYATLTSYPNVGLLASDGMVLWIPYNDKYGRQFVFDDTAHLILSRFYNNGTWSAWKDLSDAATVNSHTVNSDVPANAKFTDTTYTGTSPISISSSNAISIGTASTSAYGAAKLNTATNSTSTTEAATPSAVKTAYDLANSANTTANEAKSGVAGTLIYDHTYTIANGVATFTAHVYCKGAEVTSSYADSCFSWSYRLDNTISGTPSVVSLGTGKTKTVTISTLGYGGHIIGSFTPA